MTTNQVEYYKSNQNRKTESEKLSETIRNNTATQRLRDKELAQNRWYQNRTAELQADSNQEQARANRATEDWRTRTLQETIRNNSATNAEQARYHNLDADTKLQVAKIQSNTSRYAADRSAEATKYSADAHKSGTVYSSNQSRAASQYSADSSRAASKYSADSSHDSATYSADSNRSAAEYTANMNYNIAKESNDLKESIANKDRSSREKQTQVTQFTETLRTILNNNVKMQEIDQRERASIRQVEAKLKEIDSNAKQKNWDRVVKVLGDLPRIIEGATFLKAILSAG